MATAKIVLELDRGPWEVPQGATTIGRSRTCGLRLDDLAASRNHALLTRDGDRLMLQDLDSSNGTSVNGERIEGELELADGDVITIGETSCTVVIELAELASLGEVGRHSAEEEFGTRLVPRPSSSEAIAVGDALPVGDVLAQRTPAWEKTNPALATAPPVPPPPAPPRDLPLRGKIVPFERPDREGMPPAPPTPPAGELLPSLDEIERSLPPRVGAAPPRPATAAARVTLPPAGFMRRVAAQLIDGALILLVNVGVTFALGGFTEPMALSAGSLAGLVVALAIVLLGWTRSGSSPGKKAMGIAICSDDGTVGLSVGRALLRWLGYLVSALPAGLGFLLPLVQAQKKALHDLIAGTYVGRRT